MMIWKNLISSITDLVSLITSPVPKSIQLPSVIKVRKYCRLKYDKDLLVASGGEDGQIILQTSATGDQICNFNAYSNKVRLLEGLTHIDCSCKFSKIHKVQ